MRFRKIVARWLEVHDDDDGSAPPADPSYEKRFGRMSQDHFAKAWKLEALFGSMQGSLFNETRGGPSGQLNGLPACKRHNRFKERGYTVTRQPNGDITITTPTGELIT